MATLQDPLAKPVWPDIPADLEESVLAVLCQVLSPLRSIKDPKAIPDLFASVTVGYNSTMAAIEQHFGDGPKLEAIIVCRGDLAPMIYNPFGLSSAAGNIRLVALSKGSSEKLANASGRDASVIGIRSGVDSVLKLLENVGAAETNWVYAPGELMPRRPAPKGKESRKKL